MKRNRSIFRGCLAAAVLATLIGGNAWAATYDRGLTGSTDDQKWLQNGTVTESDGVVTYKLDGANHAFQSGEEDTAALYVQGNKVVLDNTKEGGRGNITLTGTTDSSMSSYMGVWAIGLADGSHLTVNSDLSLSVNRPDGWSSSAIYAGKLGTGEGANTDFTLNGNLTIRKGDASNPYEGGAGNMYGGYNDGYTGSRWAPTGLFNGQIDGSAWNFNGDVDIAWKGTAVATDPYYDRTEHGYSNYENAVVNMNSGSVKIDTPDDPTYGYYALANYGGSININATKDGAGTHDVTLLGNVITMRDPGGKQGGGEYFYRDGQTNIGLTTAASKWQGVIDNAGTDYAGEVNVWLQNGASWEHQSRGKTNGLDAEHMPSPSKDHYKTYDGITHVHKLAGGSSASSAGVIFQNDEAPISIADYSGYTTVIYKHDGTAPKTITGGDFKITSAAENSSITLLTDSEGITEGFADSDSAGAKNHVSEVLNKLANKLWYANHTDGHLTGTVRIAEGLTASSVAKKTGDITFSTSGTGTGQDGQGFYAYTPASDVPGSQTVTEFSDAITGDRTNNQNYVAAGVLREDDVYRFTKDSTVEVTGEKAVDVQKDVVIDASDTTLTLKNHSGMYGISQTSDNKAEITAKKLIIDAKTAARTEAIHVQGETSPSLTIHGDTEITAVGKANTLGAYVQTGSTLTFDGNVKASIDGNNGGWDYYGATALYATSAMSDTTGGTIVVNGDVDLSGSANGVFVNSGGARAIIHGGGRIQMDASKNSYAALRAEDGIIDMNVTKDEGGTVTGASDHAVQIEGNVAVTTGAVHSNDKHGTLSQINLGLNTSDSVLHGVVYNAFPAEGKTTGGLTFTGESNLWLANGAVWNNEAVGKVGKSWGGNNFKGSVLTKLTGGSDADYAGVIFQNDENPISVDNYSGNTTVIYKHDGTAPKTITGGDFKITSAAENSSITLLTDSEGITEGFADSDSAGAKNHVSEVLNKLANKLWYTNHTDGHLSGTVRIAEGLTASSVAKKTGDISFSTSGTGTGQDGQGFYAYTPASDTKNGPITTNEVIDKTRTADSDGNILVAVTEPTAEGKFVSAMYAGSTSYDKQHPMTVDLSGHDLTLQANSSNQIAAAIYATDNAHLKLVNSGKDKKLTVRASNTDTRGANGIYVKGSYAGVSIKGGVDIDGVTTKGDAAAGISIQGKQSEVTIDGPLAIRNVYGERHRGDGINASGILLTGDESRAMVDGLVTVEGVQGAALKTVGKDTVLSVAGGTITAAEDKGRDHNYYAARVEKGTININMNGAEVGSNTTKITGDMYATGQYGKRVVEYSGGELVDWVNAGKLNVALTDKDSFWQGMAAYDQYNDDYGTGGNTMHDIGEFNLYLQNGATWTNEQQSHLTTTTIKKAEYKGSQLATLHGGSDADHAGVIFQNDERPITVNTYSGNTTVIYKHDASNPQTVIGGDFKITNAAENSAITLLTDSEGITEGFADSDSAGAKNHVSEVLNKLANKLWYTNHTDGHLSGTVRIAEGLTASSVAKKTGDISFSTSGTGTGQDGQGFYAYTPASDVPGSQTVTEFSDAITGVKANDMLYVNTGVLKDDGENYYFTKDSTIIAAPSVKISNPGHAVNVDAAGKTMKLNNIVSANSEGTVITAKTMDVTVKGSNRLEAVNTTAGNLTVNGDVNLHTDGGSGYIVGIYAAHGNQLTINGNVTMKRDDGYELDGGAGFGYYAHSAIYAGNGQKVDVTGDVDFKVNGNGVFANQGGADVMLAGGSIEIDKSNTSAGHAALRAESSTVSMNVQKDNGGDITGAGTHKVNLLGNVAATTGAVHSAEPHLTSVVNLGLSTQDSAWTGVAYNAFPAEGKQTDSTIHTGAINVWLQNGAAWTNESYGPAGGSWGGNDFKGSRVTKLTGGAGADKAGVICQNDTNPISVDSYSGNTTVLYKHEIVDDTARENAGLYGNKAASIIGGDFKIAKAADGSAITLRTDRDGLNLDSTLYTDKNLVNDTLDKLANKLYYTANDGKLAGKVEIAEGLTASSVSKRLENITFSTESTGTKTAGQGYYQYDLIYPDSQITNPMSKTIDGTQEAEDAYRNAGIYKPGTDEYAFTEDPATVNGDKDKVVDGTNKNLKLKGKTLELVAQDGGTGVYTEGGRKVAIDNTADITAKDGTGVQADGEGSLVSLTNGGSVQEAASGIQATNKGTVDIKGSFDVNATDKAISATDGGTVNVAAGTLKGRIEAQNGVVNLNSVEAAAPLKVEGDIETAGEGKVTAHFKGAGSGLAGNVAGDGTVELTVSDGAAWKGDSTGEGATTVTLGKNGTWAGSSTNNKMIVNLAGRWTPTADSIVDELNGKGGTLDKSNAASGTTNIGSYSGSTNVVYRHDASDPTKIVGGKVVIGTAAANSKVNLITDRDGLDLGSGKAADKNKVSETLNRLAHMLTYKDHGANENLKGSVKIAEGLTAGSSDLRSEAITFGEDGVGKYDYTATTEEKPGVIEGNYETKLMKGAKEAMIGAISLWRNNNNDLQRRMGDLRLSREENGIWARYLGGKSAMDSQNTEVDSRYNIYQVGYDHKAGDWTFGAALDHGKSSDSLSGGHGDGELTTLSAYGSLLKKDGQYLDLIARASRVKDEYTVRGELGHKLDGDYKTWGLSLSAEYGKRFTQDNGFYFDPSVELTIGRLNGKDYDAVSDYSGNKKLHVSQEAFNSAIGRIGFGIGQETEKANYFAKLALAHEFAGDIDTTFRADNEPTKNTHIDLGDTWLELELGGTAQLSKNTYLYGTYTRSYGAEVKTKWRADAGLRFTF